MSKFFDDLKKTLGFNAEQRNIDIEERGVSTSFSSLMFGGSASYTQDKAMLLSTVYRCVNAIADGISQLPLEPYQLDSNGYRKKLIKHPTYKLLNATPNRRMTRYTFISMIIQSMLLRGNAYAYILRDEKGNAKELIYLLPSYVTINPPKNLIDEVTYTVTGINGVVEAKDMLHFTNFSYDGIIGVSTLTHAAHTLKLATTQQTHSINIYKSGAAVGGLLKVNSVLSAKQKADLKQSWANSLGSENGANGGVAILEGGADFQSVSLSPIDSDLINSTKLTNEDIARFFNVNPIKCFNLDKANYANSEIANLSFLTDTLQPIMQKLELEFERKLYKEDNIDVRFDTDEFLRSDKSALSSYFRELISNGILTPNECRKQLNMLPVEGGDKTYMQSNMMSLENISNNIPTNSAINNPIKEEEKEIITETEEEETQK